jgi:hypothetical protein
MLQSIKLPGLWWTRINPKMLIPALAILAVLFPALAHAADPDFGGVSQFRERWVAQDGLVGAAGINRPYTWGPNVPGAPATLAENYADSPGGTRRVLYLDKARMEINNPATGFVTTGLAVKELVSGRRQDGDNVFTTLAPSQTQVAGDPVASNPNTPVYASFQNLVTLGNTDGNSKPNAVGQLINQFVAKNGTVSIITPPENITLGAYQTQTGHNIAAPFEVFKNQRGPVTDPATGATLDNQPIYTNDPTSNVFGLAISEPYWVNTKIAGLDQTVLVQLFERRVLTYNPSLPSNKVEMGNLGQHYYQWRYVESVGTPATTPPTNPPTVPPTTPPTVPPAKTNSFEGKWKTNFASLTLKLTGNSVSGTFKPYAGTVTYNLAGTVSGKTLIGYYNDIPSNIFSFELDSSGNSFTGVWDGVNQWCGVKSGPLPVGCGFSGSWNSNFSTLTLTQDGDKISGSYLQYNDPTITSIAATIDGAHGRPFLNGTYGAKASDTLHFEMNGNGKGFDGNYHAIYQWCGVRSGPLPAGCGWSGTWKINYQGLTYTIHLVQNGTSVTGTQDGTTASISGSLDIGGYTLKGIYFNVVFQWYMVNHETSGQQFDGKYYLTGTEQGMCGWRDGASQPSPCYRH